MMTVPTFFEVSEDDLPHADDFLFAQRCLEGDRHAILEFQQIYRPILIAFLRQTGAGEREATEVTDSLWADLLHERENNRPRLATYCGKAALKTWLRPLVLNRLIALKRHEAAIRKLIEDGVDVSQLNVPAGKEYATETEGPLLHVMKDALETGFSACTPEGFVMLHLAYMDGLHYSELERMFATSRGSVGRALDEAREAVEKATLARVRKLDPWLELQWEDFLDLCRVASPACLGVVDGGDEDQSAVPV